MALRVSEKRRPPSAGAAASGFVTVDFVRALRQKNRDDHSAQRQNKAGNDAG